MAPASILPHYMATKLAYSQPESVAALHAVGVRITGVEELAKLIKDSKPQRAAQGPGTSLTSSQSSQSSQS